MLLRSFLQCDFIFLPFNVSYCVCAHFMSIVEKNGAVQSTSIERTLSTAQARCANRSGQCIFRFPNIQFSKCDRFTAQIRFVCQFAKSPTPDYFRETIYFFILLRTIFQHFDLILRLILRYEITCLSHDRFALNRRIDSGMNFSDRCRCISFLC